MSLQAVTEVLFNIPVTVSTSAVDAAVNPANHVVSASAARDD